MKNERVSVFLSVEIMMMMVLEKPKSATYLFIQLNLRNAEKRSHKHIIMEYVYMSVCPPAKNGKTHLIFSLTQSLWQT